MENYYQEFIIIYKIIQAHQIEREFYITSKLAEVNFPVAKPILLCEDAGVIGSSFFLMLHVEGRIFTYFILLTIQGR